MEEEKSLVPGVKWEEKPPAAPHKKSGRKQPAADKPQKVAKPHKTAQTDKTTSPVAPAKPTESSEPAPVIPAPPQDETPQQTPAPETPEVPAAEPSAAPETPERPEPAETADAPAADGGGTTASPAELRAYEFAETAPDESDAPPEESEEKRARAATISRTAQLSIAQIMAGLEDAPPEQTPPAPDSHDAQPTEPDTADSETDEDESEETLPRKLGRGAFGMARWLLLVVLFVLIIAGGGVAWLYRSATPDMLPEIKVTFDGQELTPNAYKWHVPVIGSLFRRTYAETLAPAPTELETPVADASPDLVVTPTNYSTQLTIANAAGDTVYDGSATGFRSYLFAENGTYDAKLVVKSDGSGADDNAVTGTETWQFRFTVRIRPSILLATDSVQQGGVAAVRVGATMGTDAPTIRTALQNVGFVKAANGWICYLPVPWNQQPGDVTLDVTADGYTEQLTLSVRAATYSYKDYSSTSRMTSPYIGENDAPAAVSKLFADADGEIQWSVGGFVQPFLDTFDTPLTYGMTEYAGRSYSERGTNYGYGGRTATNVVIKPKSGKSSMIAPASGKVLLAEDLGGIYGNTLVIDHGAGLKSIFYGLASLDVKTGDKVKQGQLLGASGKTVVAEMRIGTVPIDPVAVWRSRCDGLKIY